MTIFDVWTYADHQQDPVLPQRHTLIWQKLDNRDKTRIQTKSISRSWWRCTCYTCNE